MHVKNFGLNLKCNRERIIMKQSLNHFCKRFKIFGENSRKPDQSGLFAVFYHRGEMWRADRLSSFYKPCGRLHICGQGSVMQDDAAAASKYAQSVWFVIHTNERRFL